MTEKMLTVRLDEQEHRALKLYAVLQGRSVNAVVVDLIRAELAKTTPAGDRIGPEVPIGSELLLRGWTAVLADGEPTALEHAELRWLAPDELDTVAWLPADRPIVASLPTRQPESDPRP